VRWAGGSRVFDGPRVVGGREVDSGGVVGDVRASRHHLVLQCAGSAEAMTIEVRTLEAGGTADHYTVGKPGSDQGVTRPR